MKSIFSFSLLLILSVSFFSCRKGENDPLFSLRTRKNRLTGNWEIKKGSYREQNFYNTGSIEGVSIDFTETTFEYLVDVPGTIYVAGYKGPYSRKFDFKRNGTFSSVEIIDGKTYTTNGKWDFNTGVGKYKNKELLNLHYENIISPSGTKTYSGNQQNITYSLIELRNKKLHLFAEYNTTDENGNKTKISEHIELVR